MVQTTLLIVLVAAAAVYLIRRFFFTKEKTCSSCTAHSIGKAGDPVKDQIQGSQKF